MKIRSFFIPTEINDGKTHCFCPACGKESVANFEKRGKEFYRCRRCNWKGPRAIILSSDTLYEIREDGQIRHFSIGAAVEKDDKYLLFHRRKFPFVWVSPAGHLRKGENPRQAVKREVEEETGLRVTKVKLLFEEELTDDPCRCGVDIHFWRFYFCQTRGKLKEGDEATPGTLGWYFPKEIAKMKLSNPNNHFFKKMKII